MSSQRIDASHRIVLYEQNCLSHTHFELQKSDREADVVAVEWSEGSDVLAVLLRFPEVRCVTLRKRGTHQGYLQRYCVQLWHRRNYHWYLKRSENYTSQTVVSMAWGLFHPLELVVVCAG